MFVRSFVSEGVCILTSPVMDGKEQHPLVRQLGLLNNRCERKSTLSQAVSHKLEFDRIASGYEQLTRGRRSFVCTIQLVTLWWASLRCLVRHLVSLCLQVN